MLEKICEELNIKIGEKWESSDGETFKVDRNQLFVYDDGWFTKSNTPRKASQFQYERFLNGEILPKWKPDNGDKYFIPCLSPVVDWSSEVRVWESSPQDIFYFKNNLVHKTRDNAVQHAENILEEIFTW